MYHALSVINTIGKPYIIAVYPSEGLTTGGTRVCIVGMNFYEGMEVVFGTLPASAEVSLKPYILILTILCMHMVTAIFFSVYAVPKSKCYSCENSSKPKTRRSRHYISFQRKSILH